MFCGEVDVYVFMMNLSNGDFVKKLWHDMKKHWRLYVIVLPIVFILSIIYSMGQPNIYTCKIKLAPELGGMTNLYTARRLAKRFGLAESTDISEEGITYKRYSDIIQSVDFISKILYVIVQTKDGDLYSYYDYLLNHQKRPWWIDIYSSRNLLKVDTINNFQLTPDQFSLMRIAGRRIKCDIDKKTSVITLTIKDQDPVVAATLADSVCNHLKDFVIDYYVRKATVDRDYYRKLKEQAKEKYEVSAKKYSQYADSHREANLQKENSKLEMLNNEKEMLYLEYKKICSLLIDAESKIQEEKPAFTTLQSATVPLKQSDPDRMKIVITWSLVTFGLISCFVFYKEDDLKRILFGDRALGISKCPRIKI